MWSPDFRARLPPEQPMAKAVAGVWGNIATNWWGGGGEEYLAEISAGNLQRTDWENSHELSYHGIMGPNQGPPPSFKPLGTIVLSCTEVLHDAERR